MNEISELQNRRAVNMIWNAARDHSFTPDFKVYDKDGRADLYWNCIVGAARRHYDFAKIEPVFSAFQQYEDGDLYEGLLWLGLENCVFQREQRDRPALRPLREAYARKVTEALSPAFLDDYRLYDCLTLAHFMRVLGQEPKLNRYDQKLLDELEFSPDMDTDAIVRRAKELFDRWFQITAEERRRENRRRFSLKRKQTGKLRPRLRKFGLGLAIRPEGDYGAGAARRRDAGDEIRTKLSDEELRRFMTEKYGRSLFSPSRIAEIERSLCSGSHALCHLHFTRGEPVGWTVQNGFEALQKNREAAQIANNRRVYRQNLAQNRTCIARLAEKIQNSLLMYWQPAEIRAWSGRIDGGTVWRAAVLEDDRVFLREENGDMGNLSVDILLDASTSQKDRQETVSGQGYIIAEALKRCGIPCRVMSFCSMTGYTILRVFRDYNEPGKNEKIFEYVSNGCNRDGLAIRCAHFLMNSSPYEHKILIVLSDVKPNDVKKIPGRDGGEATPYEKEAGLKDTAVEVRQARADGIAVVCVFTGEDEDLPAAKLVYGRDFARIQSLDKLADTVGTLILNQIRIF